MTTTVTVAVDIDLPSGLAAQDISLRFDLSGPDTEDDTVIAPIAQTYEFATGAGTVDLWVNSEGAESTFYGVTLIYTAPPAFGQVASVQTRYIGGIALGDAASYSLAERLRNSVIPGGGGSAEQALYDALLDARDAAAASQAAASTSETNAANSAASAANSASNASTYDPTRRFATVALLQASTRAAGGAGTIWQGEGDLFREAAAGATDHDLTTAGGVKLYYLTGGLRTESGRRFQVVSGVIRNRNDGNGWQLIEDASHDHVGVASIGTNTTGVTVAFNFTAAKVVSFVAGPDERMAQAGMTVGGSVGVTSAGLWIGAPLQFWFDPVTATINAPAWFDPAGFSVAGSGATRTITHPEISSANAPPVLGTGFVSSLNCPDYGVSSFTTTGFGLQSMVDLSGYVYFNGTSWVIQSDIDTSVHTITATWEASNGGQLRVTHPATDSDFEVALISASSGHRAFVNACADTAFTVQFFDHATNTQLASPVSPIGVRFSRRRRCRAASLQSGRITCARSQARLDPTRLHDGTLPLANIWFVGVFEV